MKKKSYVVIGAIVAMVLIGISGPEVSACLSDASSNDLFIFSYIDDGTTYNGTINSVDKIELTFADVPAGSYLATLTDTTGSSQGFLLLSLFMVDGSNTFLGYTDLINDEDSDSFSFTLDTQSTLSLAIFGVSNFLATSPLSVDSVGSTFTVQLAQIPSSAPVPATVLLLGSGLAALTAIKRRRLK